MKKTTLGFLTATFLSSSAFAQSGFFGADLSFINAELSNRYSASDADPTAIRLRAGVELNENFAIEGILGLGLQDDNVGGNRAWKLELDSLYGMNLVGSIPLDPMFSLYGKVGFAKVQYEDSITNGTSSTYDDTGITAAFGGKMQFNQTGSLILEYGILPDAENGNGIEAKSAMLSVGVQFCTCFGY